MNYVSVFMVAVAIFAIGYWYAAGQYYYIGPRVKAQLILGVEDGEGKAPGLAEMSEGSSEEKRVNELGGASVEKRANELSAETRPNELGAENNPRELQ